MFATITPLWLLHNFFFHLSGLATGSFIDLFLWQQTQSFNTILTYNLGAFITWPVFAFLIAWLIEFVGPKVSYLLACLFSISFALVLIYTQDLIIAQPLLLGLIKGVALGSLTAAADFLATKLSRTEADIARFSAVSSLVKIILPPLLALIAINYQSFDTIFKLGLLAFIVLSLITIVIPFPSTDYRFNFKTALFPINKNNPEKPLLAKTSFMLGIKEGFFFSILNIIIFSLTGSLQGWGIFTLALGAISLLLSLAYQFLFTQTQSLVLLGLGAVIFTMGGIGFAAQSNLTGLILFAVSHTLLTTIFSLTLNPINSQISALDQLDQDLVVEYGIFNQIFKGIGRLVPVGILIFLHLSLEDPGLLQTVILIISIVPFTIIKLLSGSLALRHAGDIDRATKPT